MSGLILSNRKNGAYRDPFSALARDFFSWEPLGTSRRDRTAAAPAFAPLFNVSETDDAFIAEADVPGVAEADIDVTLDARVLTISGKREAADEKENDKLHVVERRYGSFSRSFTLPETIDGEGIAASLASGVLTVTIPKSPSVLPRKIPVARG